MKHDEGMLDPLEGGRGWVKPFVGALPFLALGGSVTYYVLTTSEVEGGMFRWAMGLLVWVLQSGLVIFCVVSLLLILAMWFPILRTLGPRSVAAVPTMRRLGRVSKRRQGNEVAHVVLPLAGVTLAAWLLTGRDTLGLLGGALVLLGLVYLIVSARPPAILLLGPSTPTTLIYHVDLLKVAHGLRVVSLLAPLGGRYSEVTRFLEKDVYRTSSDGEWISVVEKLIDVAAIVVLDASEKSTLWTRTEAGLALVPARRHKVFMLTADDGTKPLFDEVAHLLGPQDRSRFEERRCLRREPLLWRVHHLTESRKNLLEELRDNERM